MAVLTMAHHQINTPSNCNNANTALSFVTSETHQPKQLQQLINTNKVAMFHDFLGMKPDSPVILGPKNPPPTDVSTSACLSAGVSSSGGGGGRCPFSSSSDLASERQVGNHLEGIPFYDPRSDISGPEIITRLAGSKRSNSDSAFTSSTKDGLSHIAHDSLESLQLMKMLKNGGGVDHHRRSNDDEVLYGIQALRPASASLTLQSCAGGRLDAGVAKRERSFAGAAVQYPPLAGQFIPFVHQASATKFRDMNVSTSIISQSAADEGSRTGIRSSGILSSINAGSGISERNSSGGGSKIKSGTHVSDPESSTPSSRQSLTSPSRQMTIFYGGQAHVFDDVHPNKADVIMALAGSNGGSWSTTYSPKPTARPPGESCMASGEHEAGSTPDAARQREFRGRISGVGDGITTATGGRNGSVRITEKARETLQAGDQKAEEKGA